MSLHRTTVLVAASCMLSGSLLAQHVEFSVTNASPSATAGGFDGATILATAGSLPVAAPAPAPQVAFPPPSLPAGSEIDAMSYGLDAWNGGQPLAPGSFWFSVAPGALGNPLGNNAEIAAENAVMEGAAADAFVDLDLGALPIAPAAAPVGHTGALDADGLLGSSAFTYPASGLQEPTAANPGGAIDDLDAISVGVSINGATALFLSLDPPSAAANGFLPGDVLWIGGAGGALLTTNLYATSAQLGIGVGVNDIDALIVDDNDTMYNGNETVLFSLTPASALIGQPDASGTIILPGDVLLAGFPGTLPIVLIPAEALGLFADRANGLSDDLDAMSIAPQPLFDCLANGREDAADLAIFAGVSDLDSNNDGFADVCGPLASTVVCNGLPNPLGCTGQIATSGAYASMSSQQPFLVTATDVPANVTGILIYGLQTSTPINGVCFITPFVRTGPLFSGGGAGACSGTLQTDFNPIAAQSPIAMAGQAIYAQFLFRVPGFTGTGFSQITSFTLFP
ncbi:MAG: hypothetical protein AAF628_30880 [Planctomycetota bacterium]